MLEQLIERTSQLFLDGGPLMIAEGLAVAEIFVNDEDGVNAVLKPLREGDGMGIEVTQALLHNDDRALEFALAHEIGHGAANTIRQQGSLEVVSPIDGPVLGSVPSALRQTASI